MCWYDKGTASVKWENCISKKFKVRAGVRQGSILSPFLFTLYIDNLISQLHSSGYGCYIGDIFLGCFVYADDILLLSNSFTDMQMLLNLCFSLITDLNLSFNSNKSMFLRIGARFAACCAPLNLGGHILEKVHCIRYLGITIMEGRKFNCNFDPVKSSFYRSFNSIYRKSKMNESELISVFLTQTICLPILTYALEASGPNRAAILSLDNAIDNSIRKIFSICSVSNVSSVKDFIGIESIGTTHKLRWCKFILCFSQRLSRFANIITNLAFVESKVWLNALDINICAELSIQLRAAMRLLRPVTE